MTNRQPRTCETCACWARTDEDGPVGECRALPPNHDDHTTPSRYWPTTWRLDWCAQWSKAR